MAVTPRDEAIRTLEDGHRAVGTLIERLSDDRLERPATMGGGDWSARDLVGHLATWERLALEALAEWRAGLKPVVEVEVFGHPHGVDRLNARTVEDKRTWTAAEVLDEAERVHDTLLQEIASMSDDEWGSRAPYPTQRRTRLADLLGSILGAPNQMFGHAYAHLPDLEAYAGPRTG